MIFENYITNCFLTVLLFSGIPLAISSLSGVVVAIMQAATQIQEQSITYTVKFFTMAITITLLGNWFLSEITSFIQEVLQSLVFLGSAG